MPNALIRLATAADAEAVAGIYGPFCRDTVISFELEAPGIGEMADRIERVSRRYPWLAFMSDGRLAGYAYASGHRERSAYLWSVDVSAYVAPEFHRRGIGRCLYYALLSLLGQLGYMNAYAGIALPNEASVGLHTAAGFVPVGIYRGVGFKLGAWRDVGWFARELRSRPDEPDPPIPVSELRGTGLIEQAFEEGLRYYHG